MIVFWAILPLAGDAWGGVTDQKSISVFPAESIGFKSETVYGDHHQGLNGMGRVYLGYRIDESSLVSRRGIRISVINATDKEWRDGLSIGEVQGKRKIGYLVGIEPGRSKNLRLRVIGENHTNIECAASAWSVTKLFLFRCRGGENTGAGITKANCERLKSQGYVVSCGFPDILKSDPKRETPAPILVERKWTATNVAITTNSTGSDVNRHPWPVRRFQLLLHNRYLLLCGIGLPLYFAQCADSEYQRANSRSRPANFKDKTYVVPASFLWPFTLFGCVVFGYGWWQAHHNLVVGLRWWLLLAFSGLLMFVYGLNALLDRAEGL